MKVSTTKLLLGAGAVLAASLSLAGPLDPPAGPVAPTMKTLAEVEPRIAVNAVNTPGDAACQFRITQPGSYYLVGDVIGTPGKMNVLITSSEVTLDLNGFASYGGSAGIVSGAILSSITIRNGRVASATGMGISLNPSIGAQVHGVTVTNCGDTGIAVGHKALVRDCSVENGGSGFIAGGDTRLEDCRANSNNDEGFYCGYEGTTFLRCASAGNGGHGFDLSATSAGVLDSCRASFNGQTGFSLGDRFVVRGCFSESNTENGFELGIADNLDHCTASSNTLIGFETASHCVLRDCVTHANLRQGVHVLGGRCEIVGNSIDSNGASYAGLWLDSNGNRVEDTSSSDNGWGLYVAGTGNLVVRSTFAGNATIANPIPAGNHVAPIVASPGTNGFGTAQPWSNFSY